MFVSEAVAPTYQQLRPMKPVKTTTFPLYANLPDMLATVSKHPGDTVAHVLATCAGYAYSDAPTVAMIMARMGLEDNHCLKIIESVDAMFICSTAFLVQSACGRVVILCYRGTEPMNFINWLTDADVNPEKVSTEVIRRARRVLSNVRATRYQVVTALQRGEAQGRVHVWPTDDRQPRIRRSVQRPSIREGERDSVRLWPRRRPRAAADGLGRVRAFRKRAWPMGCPAR